MVSQRQPTQRSSDELRRIVEIRHFEVAHNASADRGGSDGRATFGDVDKVLSWAEEFVAMVGVAFGNYVFRFDDGTYWHDYDVKSSVVSFRLLAHRAGIVIDPREEEMERLLAQVRKV